MLVKAQNFSWGAGSKKHNAQTHPDFVKVSTDALTKYTVFDAGIICSVRTKAEQAELVRTGASQTMASSHIPKLVKVIRTNMAESRKERLLGKVKLSHAQDFIMFDENGNKTWKAEYFYAFAEAMRISAVKNDIPVVWGGCWKDLRTITCIKSAVDNYVARKRKQGKKPFLDLGHFHLAVSKYK